MASLSFAGGSLPTWKFEEFFNISPSDEHKLKVELAQALEIRYGLVNPDQPCSESVDGIQVYILTAVGAQFAVHRTLVEEQANAEGEQRKQLEDFRTRKTMRLISGVSKHK